MASSASSRMSGLAGVVAQPASVKTASSASEGFRRSFGIGLFLRGGAVDCRNRLQVRADSGDVRPAGLVATESAGIIDLRQQAAVGQRRGIAVTAFTCGVAGSEHRLEGVQPGARPVAIPLELGVL